MLWTLIIGEGLVDKIVCYAVEIQSWEVLQMAAYVVANYNITNPEAYADYPMAAGATVMAHGGEILVADPESEAIEGQPQSMMVILKFPSKEAAHAWYASEEYVKIKGLRTDNTEGVLTLSDEFVMPG